MFDPTVQTALNTAVEKAIHGALRYDPGSRYALQRLTGKVFALEITKPSLTFFFIPTDEQVLIQSQYEGEVHTRLKGSLPALASLARADRVNLADSGVEVFGNTGVLIELQQILQNLDIDWEDALSDVMGDVASHQAAKSIKAVLGWFGDRQQSFKRLLGEYLTEELRSLPSRPELENFYREVDELHLAADRLAAKLAARIAALHNTPRE